MHCADSSRICGVWGEIVFFPRERVLFPRNLYKTHKLYCSKIKREAWCSDTPRHPFAQAPGVCVAAAWRAKWRSRAVCTANAFLLLVLSSREYIGVTIRNLRAIWCGDDDGRLPRLRRRLIVLKRICRRQTVRVNNDVSMAPPPRRRQANDGWSPDDVSRRRLNVCRGGGRGVKKRIFLRDWRVAEIVRKNTLLSTQEVSAYCTALLILPSL